MATCFCFPSVIKFLKTTKKQSLKDDLINESLLESLEDIKPRPQIPHLKLFSVAAIDVFSQALCFAGLLFAHSQFYTIIYSSCSVHTTWLSRILLKKKSPKLRWFAVFIVTAGLAVSGIGSKWESVEDIEVLIGMIMILVGSITHSLTYVLYELFMKNKQNALPSLVVCCFNGMYASLIVLAWVVAYVVPRWHELVVVPIINAGSNPRDVLWLYTGLFIVDGIHAFAFYLLIGNIGAVSTGICKGATSVSVFVSSHFLFCATAASQCFTYAKGASLGIVVSGVLMYSFSKK
ncbi:hypothetical protein P9112_005586 [Eukaryota sp. TZLM1-RC]